MLLLELLLQATTHVTIQTAAVPNKAIARTAITAV